MKRYAIACLGCKVNTTEAQGIRQALNESGYQEVSFKEEAEVYVILTCAVTNTASSKSRQKVNQAIRRNNQAIVCVVGCYVQMSYEEMKEQDGIDILVGSSHKEKVPQLIERVRATKQKVVMVDDVRKKAVFEPLVINKFDYQTRAYLKIQDGCNQFCSYCVIPYARGKERSLTLEEVIQQAKKLAQNHREIVLTGIHTGRYGDKGETLAMAMETILTEVPQLERLRISSIEITEIDNHLLQLIQKEKRIAKHLHIPLQSGSDTVLRKMNRPYTTSQFYERLQEIKKAVKDISISTDLIVGFPQETQEEFEETKKFLNLCEFSFIHVFPFSAKDGTEAAELNGQISGEEKKRRVKECSDISRKLYEKYKLKFIQKDVEVLIEKVQGGGSFGHTSEYLPVLVSGSFKANTMVRCRCERLELDNLIATVKGDEDDKIK